MSQRALGDQFGSARKIPVERVGFRAPLPPTHDPEAMVEPASGNRQPPGVKKVIGALFTGSLKPQPVDPTTTPIRATQTRLTRGSLEKHYATPGRRGRDAGAGRSDHPVLYRDGDEHYALDGHHRIAGAMLRGEQFHAVVLGPEHEELANQYKHAREETGARYRGQLDHALELARSRGKSLYGPEEHTDPEAREMQKQAFAENHPEYQKNPVRKELGLPPRKRR